MIDIKQKLRVQIPPAHQFQRLATRQAFFVSASEICKLFLIETKHTRNRSAGPY